MNKLLSSTTLVSVKYDYLAPTCVIPRSTLFTDELLLRFNQEMEC